MEKKKRYIKPVTKVVAVHAEVMMTGRK